MNKKIKIQKSSILTFFIVVLLHSFSFVYAQQSRDLAVLNIQGKGKYTRVFNTNTNVSGLLKKGTVNNATVEFWAKHSTNSSVANTPVNWKLSNLIAGDKKFSIGFEEAKITLALGSNTQEVNLLLGDKLFKNSWHHYAITVNNVTRELKIYIDGVERVLSKRLNFTVEELFFMSDKKTDLFLAEYRAWSSLKNKKQIEAQQYRTFYKETKAKLSEHKNNGLEIVYTNTNYTNNNDLGGNLMVSTNWRNLLYEHFPSENLVKEAEYVASLKTTAIGSIRSDIAHPILNLNKIIVTASEGNGIDDPLLSGANGIILKWLHVKNTDEYQVLRKNVRAGNVSTVIHTETNVVSKQPSEELRFIDKNILPNELYEYTIQAKKKGIATLSGKNVGFVLPNGTVKGTIQTSSSVATKLAKVEAIAKNNLNPGGALKVVSGKKPLIIKNIEAFRKSKAGGTFEFWYKTPAVLDGENTLLKIGNSEVVVQKNKIIIKLNGTTYLEGARISDAKWHHYAFTFGVSGSVLFQDGLPIKNGSTNTLFTLNLSNVNAFYLSSKTSTAYHIDEVRFWNTAKSALEISKYANHIIGGQVDNLFAYYRFDFNDTHKVYNFSPTKRGEYMAVSETTLDHIAASEQPSITYATYTNTSGNYSFTSLNTGTQGITNNDNKLEFTIKPTKPRFSFLPATKVADAPRKLNNAEVLGVNFTDVSSLPITGVISYVVGGTSYPVIKGTSLEVDGERVTSKDAASVTTDVNGVYGIKVAPGRHTITPYAKLALRDESFLNEGSLRFDGKTGYAKSLNTINSNAGDFTWSAFIKPYVKLKPSDVIPQQQTILKWGALSVKLINNSSVKVYVNDVEKLSEAINVANKGKFTFFAITYNKTSQKISLQLDNLKRDVALASLNILSNLYVGAELVNNKTVNYSRANIDVLEYRNKALIKSDLIKLKEGKLIVDDATFLKISYTFNQRHGKRAINQVASVVNNNYLNLNVGADFDRTSRKTYVRDFEYSYKATTTKYNPKNNKYELVIEGPLSNVNFENKTRRSFIGNIVVPCNNSVGKWSGKIVRTDIAFPKFEKIINVNNFNTQNTVFSVNDLIPGQYRVELTNLTSSRKLQTPILDLRRGNVVYDFQYRNTLQTEVELYKYNLLTKKIGKKIPASCNGKYVVKSGDGFVMSVKVFEQYGANKCIVEKANVTLTGDAMIASQLAINTNNLGRANFMSQVSPPNFSGDYTKAFQISINENGRKKAVIKKVIITGARKNTTDFTLIHPQIGVVLHDPPGDGSSATLAKGTTFSYDINNTNGTAISSDNSAAIHGGVEINKIVLAIAAPLGVGTAVGISSPIVTTTTSGSIIGGAGFNYSKTSGSGHSITLNRSISTPTFSSYVGEDADVFIGVSNVLSIGNGIELKVNNCVASIVAKGAVGESKKITPFAYTKQSLLDVIIPNLYRAVILRFDTKFNPSKNKAGRNYRNLKATVTKLLASSSLASKDMDIKKYLYQVKVWESIIAKNHNNLKPAVFAKAPNFVSTTKKLKELKGGNVKGLNAAKLDERIAFDAGVSIGYSIERKFKESSGEESGGNLSTGFSADFDLSFFKAGLKLNTTNKISYVGSKSISNVNESGRVDSFTLTDDDAGDHFNVSIKRDPHFDTPMFLVKGGRSSCPYELGTVPREGVALVSDKHIGYGTGDESVLFNLTLKNTQIANDATRKTYIVAMDGASNSKGAQVLLNESPIFEPGTSSPIGFTLDSKSPTGVLKEVKAQLRIKRGTDAPSVISYEKIKIKMYSACEQAEDGYRSYRVDEYEAAGIKPYAEIEVTVHFTGACIENIIADAPQSDWVVNGSDKKKLDFRFRIPELKSMPSNKDFSVDLEYTIKGNSTPKILKKLDLSVLKTHLNAKTDYVEYKADVSGLTDGDYNFRIVPVCGSGGANNPNNRKTPTSYVKGKIARQAPRLVLRTPDDGGILTTGTISAKFSAPINPATVNLNSLAIRGILGGIPKPLTSVMFDNKSDIITVPHNNRFNFENNLTVEMWVNPSKYPTVGNIPILKKGSNYDISLASDGKIIVNSDLSSTKGLQPFTWTHVAIVYDKPNNRAIIYFNGAEVGSGRITTVGKGVNTDPIIISPVVSNDSFVGSLDELRIWKSNRSPLEIASNFKKQLLGNEDFLEAYFVFNDNQLAKQGVNGAPNEAIQDFTGNAKKTTATGISFVTNEAAAPLDKTKTVDDVQFTTTMSENNTIINFNMKVSDLEYVEGAKLTVIVKDKKLQDPLGNLVNKTSWSFIINKNKLKWSHNNISIAQNQGVSTIISNVDLVNTDGGIDVAYSFENLPVWLTVKKGADGSSGAKNIIRARETNSNLEFEVNNFLSPGVHTTNVYIRTSDRVTGKKLGIESFRVEVTVRCPEPVVSLDFRNNYPVSMNMKGKLLINNKQTLDINDVVKIYVNTAIRGYAKVGSNGIIDMTVFGNLKEKSPLIFKVWDASKCTEYIGIKETYNFKENGSLGTNASPINFTVGKKIIQRIPVVKGYQEVSFNVKDNANSTRLSLTSIKKLPVGSKIIDAINAANSAVLGSNNLFTGLLTELDVAKVYLLQIPIVNVKYIEAIGVPVDVNTNLSIIGGKVKNGLPFYARDLQRTSYALRSFTSTNVTEGDRVERRGLFAEYSSSKGWRGSLTHLTPGFGYFFKSTKAGHVNYSGIVKQSNARSIIKNNNNISTKFSKLESSPNYKNLGLKLDTSQFADFMYVSGVVDESILDETKLYTVLTFVNGELRGSSKSESIDGKYHYYIGIGGDTQENVEFKLYDGSTIIELENVELFEGGETLGSLQEPYRFKIKEKNNDISKVQSHLSLSQNTPNPFYNSTEIKFTIPNDSYVEINLYNLMGQNLGKLEASKFRKGSHSFIWNGTLKGQTLPSGTYIYELNNEGKRLYRKLIIIK